ncbi:MAG: Asp-tRNA(Asn)/Glu-tRNA(Gln) amidotransferase subunit GatC [Clostridiales bacterium]|nr:Asp-tRNA(Asn)/Glu-tRNA(Gln) amidotransferase subunit GatC [Clostridiales bacterium]
MKIRQVAELAKLKLEPAQEERMEAELGRILQFVQQMQPSGATPPAEMPCGNVLRADEVLPSMDRETLLSLSPARTKEYMAVPRTLAEEGEA